MQKDTWIIDGNHEASIPERLKACDTVFYFDFNSFSCFIGSVIRVIKNYRIQREDVCGNNNIEKFDKNKIEFFKSVLRFNKLNRARYYQMINDASNVNLIVFKNRKEVNNYLRRKEFLK